MNTKKIIPPTPPAQTNPFDRGLYKVGDGEVVGAVRPGALDGLQIPSRMGDKLYYRDGRKEAA